MVNKILSIENAVEISKEFRAEGKKIVLAGGCFDILHIGHIHFLEEAKNAGDVLIVFVESDETIKRIKGTNRPINTLEDRTEILAALQVVDYIIPLPPIPTDKEYDDLVIRLKPAIIATTRGDPARSHKERTAALVNAKVIDVAEAITNRSTTRLVTILNEI